MTLRLAALPEETNTRALFYCLTYWVVFCAFYGLFRLRKGPGPFATLGAIPPQFAARVAVPMTLFACAAYYVVENPASPRALITPLALLAGLWVLPATYLWWCHFQHGRSVRHASVLLLFVLLPGPFHAAVSPYRDHLVAPMLIPVLSALAAGRKLRLRSLVLIGLSFLLIATVLTRAYRAVKWYGQDLQETVAYVQEDIREDPYVSVVAEPLRRFHALDSLLLTMSVVPRAVPYSGRNVFVSAAITAFVPRAVYGAKAESNAGVRFANSIWSYQDARSRFAASASIAPSTVGDLYEAGGFTYIIIGAACVGALLGLYEGWKQHLPTYFDVALTVLLATQAAAAIERDFKFMLATFLQYGVVLVLTSAILGLHTSRTRSFAVANSVLPSTASDTRNRGLM